MKRYVLILIIPLFALYLYGCKNTTEAKPPKEETPKSEIYSYFPFKENVEYEYEGQGNALISYNIFNTFVHENTLQRRLEPAQNYDRQTEIFKVENGTLVLINGDTTRYHFEDETGNAPQKDMVLLKEPLTLGATWTVSGTDTATVTGVDVDISLPFGNYKALEVSSVTASGYDQKEYYVKDIGLVKTMYKVNGGAELSSTLKKITENTTLKIPVDVYYPIKDADETAIKETVVSLSTNYNLIKEVNKVLRTPPPDTPENLLPILTTGSVEGIIFAANTSAAILNFDKNIYEQKFESENAERAMIFAVANTVGHMVSVDQVFIQVDNKPYSGVYVKLDEETAFEIK
ncbi:hypothetical protein FACS1894188_00450 [Clostridia bacterium]|nr:hypothetical protein FACS1894188_00450 [Clostridia bacterium]